MRAPAPSAWSLREDLAPPVTWLLEASAGTGKTYQIASIFTLLVALHGVRVERILTITFTRAATAELSGRVRKRLREALDALEALGEHPEQADASGPLASDEVMALLAAAPDRAAVRTRLEAALRSFDLAPISTIHSFAQQALESYAFESRQDLELELVADVNEVLDDLVGDALAELYANLDASELARFREAGVTRAELRAVAKSMTGAEAPVVLPAQPAQPSGPDSLLAARADVGSPDFAPLAAFARGVRARFEAELARRRALTFDSMLSRLAAEIRAQGGAHGPLAARLRASYDAVFVDEFQDTDRAQWTVLEAAFHGHVRTFLIGDPKQAIYGFRGADVQVYLQAKTLVAPERRRTLVTNHRSDVQVIEAVNHLFGAGTNAFDEPTDEGEVPLIDYEDVRAHHPTRLSVAGPGLEVRWVDATVVGGARGEAIKAKQTALLAAFAAREAGAWLAGERALVLESRPDGTTRRRLPEPFDFAVLVNSHQEASAVREAFRRAGIPAVAPARASVFGTAPARWLAAWLDAVATGRDREARAAAVTPLLGWTAEQLAWALDAAERGAPAVDEARAAGVEIAADDWAAWLRRLRRAQERYAKRGFAEAFDRDASELGVLQRVLALPRGERHATDLRHLFELLHAEERARRLAPDALAAHLRSLASSGDDERSQRLESEARAVKIQTIHASKGLEFGIVLLPFSSTPTTGSDRVTALVLRERTRAVLDASPKSTTSHKRSYQAKQDEDRREALRRLYVAVTRAKHCTILWHGPIGRGGAKAHATAFGRLLMRRPHDLGFPAHLPDLTRIDEVKERLFAAADRSKRTILPVWEKPLARAEPRVASAGGPPVPAADFGSELDPHDDGEHDDDAGSFTPYDEPPAPEAPAPRPRWPHAERPTLDSAFVVTSYTRLSASSAVAAADRDEKVARDAAVEVAAVEVPIVREGAADGAAVALEPPAEVVARPTDPPDELRLRLGSGTAYGTFVHGVLEHLDFVTVSPRPSAPLLAPSDPRLVRDEAVGASGEAPTPLRRLVSHLARASQVEASAALELERLLPALLSTPLDSVSSDDDLFLPAGFSLSQVAAAHRQDELGFDLRLGEGTRFLRRRPPHELEPLERRPGRVSPRAVFDALALEPRHPRVAAWLDHQARRATEGRALVGNLAGVLTGSIDLLFRAPGPKGLRYYLADYKTNRIAGALPGHHDQAWMAWKMATSGYPLQSLLYTLALHRLLRQRLGGAYSYDACVGGTLYLFVRGMSGPTTPRDGGRCLGVFAHRWARATVEALDAALEAEPEGAAAESVRESEERAT